MGEAGGPDREAEGANDVLRGPDSSAWVWRRVRRHRLELWKRERSRQETPSPRVPVARLPWHTMMPSIYGILMGMKNFHVPLPDETYEHLKAAAVRSKVPATTLAREAIDFWLRQQLRKARHDAIAAYAAEAAGTVLDLDTDLEAAGIQHLTGTGRKSK